MLKSTSWSCRYARTFVSFRSRRPNATSLLNVPPADSDGDDKVACLINPFAISVTGRLLPFKTDAIPNDKPVGASFVAPYATVEIVYVLRSTLFEGGYLISCYSSFLRQEGNCSRHHTHTDYRDCTRIGRASMTRHSDEPSNVNPSPATLGQPSAVLDVLQLFSPYDLRVNPLIPRGAV